MLLAITLLTHGKQHLTHGKRHRHRHHLQPLLFGNRSWYRSQLGQLVEGEGGVVGVELGVQAGIFAREILQGWTRCKRFYLVDSWRQMENYLDSANVDDERQFRLMFEARRLLNAAFSNRDLSLLFLPMLTSEAAELVHQQLDFVYVDARHDYCGVSEDIAAWWPKVRRGGIMAGHDFLTNEEVRQRTPEQDWSVCWNGTVHPGSVKQAVLDFVAREGLNLEVSADEWPSWVVRKPMHQEG